MKRNQAHCPDRGAPGKTTWIAKANIICLYILYWYWKNRSRIQTRCNSYNSLPENKNKNKELKNKLIYNVFSDNKVSMVSLMVRQSAVKPDSCRSGGYSCPAPGTPGRSSSLFFSWYQLA